MTHNINIACVLPPRAPAWMAKSVFEAQKAVDGKSETFCAGSPVPLRRRTLQYKLDTRLYARTSDALAMAPMLPKKPHTEKQICDLLQGGEWDVILNFSDCNISLATPPRFGVWTHVLYKQDEDFVCELTADVHDAEIGTDTKTHVLMRGVTAQNPLSGRLTTDQIFWKIAWYAQSSLQKIQLYGSLLPWATLCKKINRPPLNIHNFHAFSNPLSLAFAHLTQYKGKRINWSVRLYANELDFPLLAKAEYTEPPPPKDHFWADPFLLDYDGKSWLFMEELPHSTGKGVLSICEVRQDGITTPEVIIEEDYHLSYPFVFLHEGIPHLIPESSSTKTIDLYECEQFPLKWRKKSTLMQGMHFVDTSLLFHDDKWWMFTCAAKDSRIFNRDELYLYYSASLESGDWTPHPMNPVVSNTRSARCAGQLSVRGKKIFRPSQDNAHSYGHALVWNEILTLTTSEYREVCINRLEYSKASGIHGTHSYNTCANWTVTDVLRMS